MIPPLDLMARLSDALVRLPIAEIEELAWRARLSSRLDPPRGSSVVRAGLVGISLSAATTRPRSNGLKMASVTAGVSQRRGLPPDVLAKALRSGVIPAGYEAQVAVLLDEAPLEILVKAVGESSRGAPLAAKKIWAHLYRWARDFKSVRPAWGA